MKRTKLIFALLAVLSMFACEAPSEKTTTSEKSLRHVVMFQLKDSLPADTVHAFEQAFVGLKTLIPTIQHFEWGVNNSPEKLNQGLTHCFVATFSSEKDRNDYLVNPHHVAFVENYVKPYIVKPCVLDYWAE